MPRFIDVSGNRETTKENITSSATESSCDNFLTKYQWIVRTCSAYFDEYEECNSIRGQLYQYYIHGSFFDCSDWQKDYKECLKFREGGSPQDAEAIIHRELYRMKARRSLADLNDVWQPRLKPPSDWNAPLPEWKQRQHFPSSEKQKDAL